jgi:hypothetical protein
MARARAVLSARSAEAVAARTIASEWLAAGALVALVTRPEAIGPAPGLPDRKFWNWTGGRRLALARQRGANEGTMHRSLFVFAIGVAFLLGFSFRQAIIFRPETRYRFGIVGVLVAFERSALNRDRTDLDLEVVGVLAAVIGWPGLRRRHAFWSAASDLCIQCGWGVRLPALARDLCVLIFVLGVTGRAARPFHVVADHRHDGVIRQPTLARAVIIQNVTKPKLALLHPNSPRIRWRGRLCRKADVILTEQVSWWQ